MTEPNSNIRKLPGAKALTALSIAAILLRTIFIFELGAITVRVTLPSRNILFTEYSTWGDFVNIALGLAICTWLVMQLFKGPVSVDGYRTWIYLGLFAVPLALICLVAIW